MSMRKDAVDPLPGAGKPARLLPKHARPRRTVDPDLSAFIDGTRERTNGRKR